jgi:ubiquilin
MGPLPDTETMLSMLENPQFQSTMNEALQNPVVIDMMIQQNPMLRGMGPGVRQMMQSPEFRRMLTDPNSLRQMAQLQRGFGLGGGAGNMAFPAPGVTNTTPEENRNQQPQTNQNASAGSALPALTPLLFPGAVPANNPLAALFGATPAGAPSATSAPAGPNLTGQDTTGGAPTEGVQNQQNPFALLFNPALLGSPPQSGAAGENPGAQQGTQPAINPFSPQNNPFLRDPVLLSQALQTIGGQNGSGEAANNPLAALWPGLGGGTRFGSPPPQDNQPPEERYAEQLRQLNEMGFYEFERNIEALRRTGGSVQGAVEYLLSHPS